jgi:hypothetical protein
MATTDLNDDYRGAYSLTAFCHAFHVGLTFAYQEIRDGKLRAVKAGAKTLILRRTAHSTLRLSIGQANRAKLGGAAMSKSWIPA